MRRCLSSPTFLVPDAPRVDTLNNSTTPQEPSHISHLPPEILFLVFSYCAGWKFDPFVKNPLAWGSVCKLWRSVATSPGLWSQVDVSSSNVNLTRRCLRLSQASPLALRTTSRTSQLRLPPSELSPPFAEDYIDRHFGPNVTRLSLRSPPVYCGRQKTPCQPLNLNIPCVHTLSLDRVPVAWNSARLAGLKHLSIKGLASHDMLSPPQIHSILIASPDIESICVMANDWPFDPRPEDKSCDQGETTSSMTSQVRLYHLKEFIVSGPPTVISELLRPLVIPETAYVSTYVTSLKPDQQDSTSIMPHKSLDVHLPFFF
ncbi:hypothetical protein BKA70DRAFT_1459386 [Coprinopsis sp. MPI-PUGE-AT-0042]|nr:hypothetical protein BKA70DRAFT_1459386 [Coprinopsis sp. MPI-PUGE-AT-0042]